MQPRIKERFMHRRSFILGLLASLSSAATMSLAASVEALAAERRVGNGVPAIDNWDEFSAQRRRRRFRFGRRRRRRGRGGGDDAPETSVGVGGSGARGGGDSILTTRKPVPLSDQAPPPAAPRPRARE
jgi:hypothetical protein